MSNEPKKPKKKAVVRKRRTAAVNTPEKYVFGRPTKYDRSYPEKVFNACKKGDCLTIASICVLLDIDRDTYLEWLIKFPDFTNAIKKGIEHRKNHMEKKGLLGISAGKSFNALPWFFLMKNMFPDEYKDKREVEVEDKDKEKTVNHKFSFDLSEDPDHLDARGGDTPSDKVD